MMDPEGIAEEGDYDNNALTTLQSSASSLNSMQLLLSSSCPGLDNYRFKSYMVIQPQSFQLVFVLTNQLQIMRETYYFGAFVLIHKMKNHWFT